MFLQINQTWFQNKHLKARHRRRVKANKRFLTCEVRLCRNSLACLKNTCTVNVACFIFISFVTHCRKNTFRHLGSLHLA